jgi:predicted kinase
MKKRNSFQGYFGSSCPECDMPLNERGRCCNPRCEYPVQDSGSEILPAETDRRTLIVLCGLPGVGKSTVVKKLQKQIGGKVLRTDEVRKRCFDDPQYTQEETYMVYGEMFGKAGRLLQRGHKVILDGTFRSKRLRKEAKRVAERNDVSFRLVKIRCNSRVVKSRIENREGLSDADFSVHKRLREKFEPIEQGEVVDNSGDISALLKQVAFITPNIEHRERS